MTIYHHADFMFSAAQLSQLAEDTGKEVAFAGRSNAGKSSVLNTLTQKKSLARTSRTPGRTQLINFFSLDSTSRLVDLPGYGYAKVSKEIKLQWQEFLSDYLEVRTSLVGLVIVMDIRHPCKDTDQSLIEWAIKAKIPIHILLNKSDKLKRGPAIQMMKKVQAHFQEEILSNLLTLQLFSSLKKQGIEELHGQLDQWFSFSTLEPSSEEAGSL